MTKRKKRKYNLQSFQNQFTDIVNKHKHELPTFDYNTPYNYSKLDLSSWFKNKQYTCSTGTSVNVISTDELEVAKYRCKKIKMVLTDIHKQIIQQWFKASTYMYNETINYIRNNYPITKTTIIRSKLTEAFKKDKTLCDKYYIRTKMNKIRTNIQKLFTIIIDKQHTVNNKILKCKIDAHALDKTIFQLVQNIKGAKTRLLTGNIKRFRLKYWKYNRPSQTIEFEKRLFNEGIFCKTIFENLSPIKYYYNGEEITIDNVTADFKVNYNSILDEYILLLSEAPVETNIERKKQLITLDPGLRTFMTGLDNNTYSRFGINVNNKIRKDLTKLHSIKV
ncbi:MAG: hypothetical protein ACK5XN_37960, partial [Bacteroidota bacterium]